MLYLNYELVFRYRKLLGTLLSQPDVRNDASSLLLECLATDKLLSSVQAQAVVNKKTKHETKINVKSCTYCTSNFYLDDYFAILGVTVTVWTLCYARLRQVLVAEIQQQVLMMST